MMNCDPSRRALTHALPDGPGAGARASRGAPDGLSRVDPLRQAGSAPERIELRNQRGEIETLEARIRAELEHRAYPASAQFAVRLAMEEAIVNAFMHGHRGLSPSVPISVEFTIDAEHVVVAIEDQGPGFRPDRVADPTLSENLELPSGRGLMLIRSFMSEAWHELNGRRLVMVYRRPQGTPS
jgi:serine/threonine-protein kinase RsbW